MVMMTSAASRAVGRYGVPTIAVWAKRRVPGGLGQIEGHYPVPSEESRSEPERGGPRLLRKDALSGAAHQPGRAPRTLQEPGPSPSHVPSDLARRATTRKPRDPRRRLRHIPGGELRASRARCSNYGNRRQRLEPAPHARSSEQIQSRKPRAASALDREGRGDRPLFRPGGLYGSAASPARPGPGSLRPS